MKKQKAKNLSPEVVAFLERTANLAKLEEFDSAIVIVMKGTDHLKSGLHGAKNTMQFLGALDIVKADVIEIMRHDEACDCADKD